MLMTSGKKWSDLFKISFEEGISNAKEEIRKYRKCQTDESFLEDYAKNNTSRTCSNSWDEPRLLITCHDCSNDPNACYCLKCFLEGNHEGHKIHVRKEIGSCDCGDPSFLKESGFCRVHKHSDNKSQDIEFQNFLSEIFKGAFKSITEADKSEHGIEIFLDWACELPSKSDDLKLSIASGFGAYAEKIVSNMINYSREINNRLCDLFGELICISKFKNQISYAFLKNFEQISTNYYKSIKNGESAANCNLQPLVSRSFHFFSKEFIEFSVKNNGNEIEEFYLNFIQKQRESAFECREKIRDSSIKIDCDLSFPIVDILSSTEYLNGLSKEQISNFIDNYVKAYTNKDEAECYDTKADEFREENVFLKLYYDNGHQIKSFVLIDSFKGSIDLENAFKHIFEYFNVQVKCFEESGGHLSLFDNTIPISLNYVQYFLLDHLLKKGGGKNIEYLNNAFEGDIDSFINTVSYVALSVCV